MIFEFETFCLDCSMDTSLMFTMSLPCSGDKDYDLHGRKWVRNDRGVGGLFFVRN